MQKIKDFLLNSMGSFGFVIFFLISTLVCILPILMFELPFGLTIILALVVEFVLINIPFVFEILYVIGLFGAMAGPQDFIATIYYIVFAIVIGSCIINLIRVFTTK